MTRQLRLAATSLFLWIVPVTSSCGKPQNQPADDGSSGTGSGGGGSQGGTTNASSTLFYLERDGCSNDRPRGVASPSGAFTVAWVTSNCTDVVQNGVFGARYENGSWSTPTKIGSTPTLLAATAVGETDAAFFMTLNNVTVSELRYTKPEGWGGWKPAIITRFPAIAIAAQFNAAGQGAFVSHSYDANNSADQAIEIFNYSPTAGWSTYTNVERITPTTGQNVGAYLVGLHLLPSGNSNVFYRYHKYVYGTQPNSPYVATTSIELRKFSPGGALLSQGKIAEVSESVPYSNSQKVTLNGFTPRANRKGDAIACYSLLDKSVPTNRTATFLCRKSQAESDFGAAELVASVAWPNYKPVATALSEAGDTAVAFTINGELRSFVSTVSTTGWTEKSIEADDILYPVRDDSQGAFYKADNVLRLVWRTTNPDVTFYTSALQNGAFTPRASLGKLAATPSTSQAGFPEGPVLQGGGQALLLWPYNNSVRYIFAGLWL